MEELELIEVRKIDVANVLIAVSKATLNGLSKDDFKFLEASFDRLNSFFKKE